MKKQIVGIGVVIVIIIAVIIAVVSALGGSNPYMGVLVLNPGPNSSVTGSLVFEQADENSPVTIKGVISNLSPGKHGFHVHESGDLREGCKSAGGHYNPLNNEHAAPTEKNRHIGDLGNIEASTNGVAEVDISDEIISLTGEHSIIGRAIVVHAKEDDLGLGGAPDSKTTGAAGARVACGIIGILNKK